MQKTNNKSSLNLSKLIPGIVAVETSRIKDGCEESTVYFLNDLQSEVNYNNDLTSINGKDIFHDEAEFLRLLSIAWKRIAKGLYADEKAYITTVPNAKLLRTGMFAYNDSEWNAIRIYTDADYLKRMFRD
tara:strand:- start:1138 stop:1527 length:390 start_codon:yes stop_codon:yes gene_type:complete